MPVAVVGPDGDQRDPGATGREEGGIGVPTAVVRHLQHVGAQVDAAVDDPRLRLPAEVAGEQHPHAVAGDPDDEGQVVGLGRGRRELRWRCEDLHGDGPDRAAVAGDQHRPVGAGPPGDPVEPVGAVVGG